MIHCEQFENRYEQWREGRVTAEQDEEMQRHLADCPYCRTVDSETIRLRKLLVSSPELEPSVGFDYRLRRRLEELSSPGKVRRRSIIPRWAALGAGLATGLAVGFALLLPFMENDQEPAIVESADISVLATQQIVSDDPETVQYYSDTTEFSADTMAYPDDQSQPESTYNPDQHSQMVSTDR